MSEAPGAPAPPRAPTRAEAFDGLLVSAPVCGVSGAVSWMRGWFVDGVHGLTCVVTGSHVVAT